LVQPVQDKATNPLNKFRLRVHPWGESAKGSVRKEFAQRSSPAQRSSLVGIPRLAVVVVREGDKRNPQTSQ
jgi:hypothetical protein